MRRLAGLSLAVLLGLLSVARADGPKDNLPDKVRPIPPQGIPLPEADRQELRTGLTALRQELDRLTRELAGKPDLLELLPDVEVYYKAVLYAVEHGEFFNPKEIPVAKNHLTTGLKRAEELRNGKPSWLTATGPVVRGYRSRIDGSVQPYGLVVPKEYAEDRASPRRLDFWWHGRGETLSEVNFIADREKNPGQFTPPNTFVLHPYGRYCNANKFAGEIDTFECLEHVRKHYRIDDRRIVARGFSMGGAACWQFAVHYPTLWCAAAPGAGFSETPEFLNVFQNEKVEPTWYEKKLWRMYNATDYALNLFNLPTVAYSGEIDRQKQAADVMAREMKKVGLDLVHIIGPKTGHSYEKGAKEEINRRIDALAEKRRPPLPHEIKFITYTLRYNRCGWVTLLGLEKHWEPATVTGLQANGQVTLTTRGVTALQVQLVPAPNTTLTIDGQTVAKVPALNPPRSVTLVKLQGKWSMLPAPPAGLRKAPGLQGPIDDAFMDRFVMVKPTGQPMNEKVGAWAAGEMKHAIIHWRSQFRGDAPVQEDTALTEDDIKNSNLILWGDPSSNAVLARIADKLPVKWTKEGVKIGDQTFDAGTHVPVLIYPNPLNPSKYVVLNSGFTFREYDYLNNARQVPKLPDYAVLDVTTPPNSRWPGRVVRAGFFGEEWQLLPDDGR